MEEILKKYGISKQLFLKVTQFIKLQVDQKIVYTLTDQEQIAAEILIMASEGMNVKTGEKQCNLPVVVFSEAELKAKLDEQKEEHRKWLEGEGYELLAERL